MSNAIAESVERSLPYFAAQKQWVDAVKEGRMTLTEFGLCVLLASKSHDVSSPAIAMTAKQACEMSGVCDNTLRKLLRGLERQGHIERSRGRVRFCDKGNPIPPLRKQRELRAERHHQKATFFEGPGPNIFKLGEVGNRRYFEARLKQECSGAEANVLCPFHSDHTPSLSIKMATGQWFCHAEKIGGHIVDFELKFSACDYPTATANISALAGAPGARWTRQQRTHKPRREPIADYHYCDEQGTILFTVHRYDSSPKFLTSHSAPSGRTVWSKTGISPVLYRLPEVIAANTVCVTEGEKDADNVRALGLLDANDNPIAVTTAPFGSGNWRADYAQYLEGKRIFILADNDDAGMIYVDSIRDSLADDADCTVITFTELPEHGDVSDYLQQGIPAMLVEKLGQGIHLPVAKQAAMPATFLNICHTPVNV